MGIQEGFAMGRPAALLCLVLACAVALGDTFCDERPCPLPETRQPLGDERWSGTEKESKELGVKHSSEKATKASEKAAKALSKAAVVTDTGCASECKTCVSASHTKGQCTSCKDASKRIAINGWRKNSKGKNVAFGFCMPLPELRNFDGRINRQTAKLGKDPLSNIDVGGTLCTVSTCHEQTRKGKHAPAGTMCSRSCLIGGRLTYTRNLRRHANTDKTGAVTSYAGTKFAGKTHKSAYSAPLCAFHKVVMCEKLASFNEQKCWKAKTSQAKEQYCKRDTCDVRKEVSCLAILPYGMTQKELA